MANVSTRCRNVLRPTVIFAVVALAILTGAAGADDAPKDWIAWRANLVGAIGAKVINVTLQRIDGHIEGDYCYGDCNPNHYREPTRSLVLSGRAVDRYSLEIDERRAGDDVGHLTGHWSLRSEDGHFSGRWSSQDGKETHPIALGYAHAAHDFPFEMRIEPCSDIRSCARAIVLYQKQRRVQELVINNSESDWTTYAPNIVEMNFDGWPDLEILASTGARGRAFHRGWLYDPTVGRMVEADGLDGLDSPSYDWRAGRVYSMERAAGDREVIIHQWSGTAVEEVSRGANYMMPVKIGETIRYCDFEANYQNGAIRYVGTLFGKDKIEQFDVPVRRDGGIVFDAAAASKFCRTDLDPYPRIRVDVYAEVDGRQLVWSSEKALPITIQGADGPRHCQQIPVLDGDRIINLVVPAMKCDAP